MSMLVIILILVAIIALGIILTSKKSDCNEHGSTAGPGSYINNDKEPRPDDEEHADDELEKE